jgi:hypothetical protein
MILFARVVFLSMKEAEPKVCLQRLAFEILRSTAGTCGVEYRK